MKYFFVPGAQLYNLANEYGDDWAAAAPQICAQYMASQTERHHCFTSPQSFIEFSRMLALAYEFKHLATQEIQEETQGDGSAGQRILHGFQKPKLAYTEEIIRAYLKAAGTEDVDAVLDSFKKTGTGAIHRQPVVAGATVSNLLGALQTIAHDLTAKLVLSSARLVFQAFTSAAVIASGDRRLRVAATEEVFPLGRADTAPIAKGAPDVLFASKAVLSKLPGVGRSLDELKGAIDAFQATQSAASAQASQLQSEQDPAQAEDLAQSRDRLNIAFAEICHKLVVKENYKAASENAKVEWRGNEINLYVNTTGTTINLIAGSLTIMSPLLIDGVVTGGLFAGTTALAALLHAGYQLSAGPSKDGDAKARRAIIALTKLCEVLDPAASDAIHKRAGAYEKHRNDQQALLAELNAIAQDEAARRNGTTAPSDPQEASGVEPLDPAGNWREYSNYMARRQAIRTDAGITDEACRNEQLEQHDTDFYNRHASRLTITPLIEAWRPQIQIRMDTAHRLLVGKLAQAMKHLLRSQNPLPSPEPSHGPPESPSPADGKKLKKKRNELADAKARVKQLLSDVVHFELARDFMKRENALAGPALAEIKDEDVRNLFCGTTAQRIDATYRSKQLTAGESERYTLLNAGANALGIGMTLGLQAADVQINDAKRAGTYTGPQVNDFKLLGTQQAGATPSAPMSTGYRAAFQRREMKPRLNRLDPGSRDPNTTPLTMRLPNYSGSSESTDSDGNGFQQQLQQQILALMQDMKTRRFIPRHLHLTFGRLPEGEAAASGDGSQGHQIAVDLEPATAFHRVRYKKAPIGAKAGFVWDGVATMLKQTLAIYGGLLTQAAAQVTLKKTRECVNEAKTLAPTAREMLASSATTGATRSEHESIRTEPGQVPGSLHRSRRSASAAPEIDLRTKDWRMGGNKAATARSASSVKRSSAAASNPMPPVLPNPDTGAAFASLFGELIGPLDGAASQEA